MKKTLFLFPFLLFQVLHGMNCKWESVSKSRVVVLTDMLNEPDDSQTMVRLLMYSNLIDIEGLIAVSSCHQFAGKDDADAFRNDVQPQAIIERINAYGMIRGQLFAHANGWPTEQYLLSVVGRGPSGYGMDDVGDGHSTDGSEIIINALLKEDSRPLYLCINAGANTLAQALWDLRTRVDSSDFEKCLGKLRVYDDAGQDNAGAWIAHHFPQIHYRRSQSQVFNFMNNSGPVTWDPQYYPGEGQHLWAMKNVMIGHGPLGALYPIRKQWRKHTRWHTLEGGGTTTWIGHINKGLWHPDKLHWGGWGGRFEQKKATNPLAGQLRWADLVETENQYKPFYMFTEASDRWSDPETGKTYEGIGVPVYRWRRAYQNDFEARIDWCVRDFESCNHNPVAVLNGNRSDDFLHLYPKVGEVLSLDASDSFDPDGDQLGYRWYFYPEAGSGDAPTLDICYENRMEVEIVDSMGGETFHLILEVKDHSEIVRLCDYRRIVIHVL